MSTKSEVMAHFSKLTKQDLHLPKLEDPDLPPNQTQFWQQRVFFSASRGPLKCLKEHETTLDMADP